METLESLRDVANGKRRRFFDVSLEAGRLFKQWVTDWHVKGVTLERVLNQWEMDYVLDEYLVRRARCVGKRIVVDVVDVRAPWDGGRRGPRVNDELLYLVLKLVTTPKCERLGVCPYCDVCFVALRSQTYCCGEHSRLAASKRIAGRNFAATRDKKLKFVEAAKSEFEQLPEAKKRKYEWKKWVAKRATSLMLAAHHSLTSGENKITPNFITYALAEKDLTSPKGEK